MRFCLINSTDGSDELAVFIPGDSKTVMMIPREALAHFLPILHESTDSLPFPTCAACGADLPGEPENSTRLG